MIYHFTFIAITDQLIAFVPKSSSLYTDAKIILNILTVTKH